MDYVAIIISILAMLGAGFAFLRASSSHRILTKRIEKLKDNNAYLEERLRRVEGYSNRGKKNVEEVGETVGRRSQPRQERQEQQQEQRNEPRQKQRDRQERQQQDRQPQQERQPQERQERRERPERQERAERQERPERQERQPQQERQPNQERQPQQQQQEEGQPGQSRRRRNENRRRNEPMDRTLREEAAHEEPQFTGSGPINLEVAGGDLLAELEQAAANQPTPLEETVQSGKKYAIIPEDGVIRQHQLQQQPDSDSYIEVDVPAEGGSRTHYRFNLAGNHAFVISQGIDRLENAFSFEKPSNRMVSQVVQQGDGIPSRVGNGWKIEEKARIDFR